jgi:hypothetical protein
LVPGYLTSTDHASFAAKVSFPGFGTTGSTACVGNDARLSDARPASDVYTWAKAATKPTYTYTEVGADVAGAAAARQAAYANLTTIGTLANAAGWLHNDGSGVFVYSTPSGYSLPAATTSTLGGVIVGTGGLSVSVGGTLSIPASTFDAYGAAALVTTTSIGAATSAKFIAGAGALTGPASPLTIGTIASHAAGDYVVSTAFIAGAGALTGPVAPLTIGTAAGHATADFAPSSGIALSSLAPIPNNTVLGNISGASAVPSALTVGNVQTLLGLGSAAYTASTAYDAAGAYLLVTPTTLGLVIGTHTQAHSAKLDTFSALANGAGWLHNDGSGVLAYSTPSKTDVGLSAVENTALSTWAGTANLTTLGTIATGVWHGTAIADTYISSAATWNGKQAAITFGTGVLTALGVNVGSAGAPVLFNGALGTPSGGALTNCGGLPLGGLATIANNTVLLNISGGAAVPIAGTGANVRTICGLATTDTPTFAGLTLTNLAALTTPAESWVGPSSTAGIYFKNGNVGIGTTSPTQGKLQVRPIADENISLINIGGGVAGIQVLNDAATTYGPFAIYAGNILLMPQGGGKVGIGTTSPGTTLDVNGTIHATGYQSSDSSAGISTTVTTASLVGKTITIKNGLITAFA